MDLMRLAMLLSYFYSVKYANRLAVVHTSLTLCCSFFLLILWIVSVGLFNSAHLWHWACRLKDEYGSQYANINWGQSCIEQVPKPHVFEGSYADMDYCMWGLGNFV